MFIICLFTHKFNFIFHTLHHARSSLRAERRVRAWERQPADRSMVVGQFLAPFSVPLTEAILPTSRVAPERSGEQQLHPERGGKCEPRYSSRWLLITYAVSASGMGNEWLIFHMMQQNDQYLFRLNVYPGGGGAEVRTLLVSHRHDCTEMRWDHRHPVRQSMGE